MSTVDPCRVRKLNDKPLGVEGPVLYWMSRDQRATDNWALLYAQQLALDRKLPLKVVFALRPDLSKHSFSSCTRDFMFAGLAEVEQQLATKNIPFHCELADPATSITRIAHNQKAAAIITDFNPLRWHREWSEKIAAIVPVSVQQVDTHNIVPCWQASDKQEYAVRTIRPKIHKLLKQYLTEFPQLKKHPYNGSVKVQTDWSKIQQQIAVTKEIPTVTWLNSGTKAANKMLGAFLATKLADYAEKRNDPTLDGLSNLSPYLHFGQLGSQTIALAVQKESAQAEAFLEELIVRKELSDNFCFYNQNYDNPEGFPDWAQKTLQKHFSDPRPITYTFDQLEVGETDDPAWNSAQRQMVQSGKMHGYMRMYWGKKLLEWAETPGEAQEIAIRLNDLYQLDGRDPNGYTGIAWSIGGVHDRPWQERPIFGTVRYMNFNGLKRKFALEEYIKQWYSEKEDNK